MNNKEIRIIKDCLKDYVEEDCINIVVSDISNALTGIREDDIDNDDEEDNFYYNDDDFEDPETINKFQELLSNVKKELNDSVFNATLLEIFDVSIHFTFSYDHIFIADREICLENIEDFFYVDYSDIKFNSKINPEIGKHFDEILGIVDMTILDNCYNLFFNDEKYISFLEKTIKSLNDIRKFKKENNISISTFCQYMQKFFEED